MPNHQGVDGDARVHVTPMSQIVTAFPTAPQSRAIRLSSSTPAHPGGTTNCFLSPRANLRCELGGRSSPLPLPTSVGCGSWVSLVEQPYTVTAA